MSVVAEDSTAAAAAKAASLYSTLGLADAQRVLDELDGAVAAGSRVADVTRIAGGLANANYRGTLADGRRLLFKVCEEKSDAELRSFAAAVDHLRRHGFPTAYPARRRPHSGPEAEAHLVRLDGVGRVLVFDWIDGRAGRVGGVSAAALRDLGAHLAALHAVPRGELPLPAFPMGVAALDATLAALPADHALLTDHPFGRLLTVGGALARAHALEKRAAALPHAIAHGDVFPDNVMFTAAGDTVAAVVDFEEVCWAPRVLDLAMAVVGCAYAATDDVELDGQLARALLAGYAARAAPPLAPEEVAALPDYLWFCALAIAFWRWRQFNLRYPGSDLRDHYLVFERRAAAADRLRPADLLP